MSVRSLISALALLAAAPLVPPPAPAMAQEAVTDTDAKFSTEELDQILAPIALYPDDLLSNVLMASTYPLEVVQAARWIEEPESADLKGATLTRAVDDKDWDPSVKALTQFPDVLAMMSEQIDWTQKLGDAFIASEADVMDRIQFLRDKAEEAGNLESNEHQTVTTKEVDGDDYIYIEPADPEIVYVPVYDPLDVYGSWWYPDYPPYYWEPDNVIYVNGFFWGAGVVIAPSLWAWSRPRWHDHYIHIDRHRYNRLERHRRTLRSGRWRHEARHRRGVKFKGAKAWRKTWHPKRTIEDARKKRVHLPHRDGKSVLKPGGDNRFNTLGTPGPKLKGDARRRRAIGEKPSIHKPGTQPPAFKSIPDKRTFSGPKKGGTIPKVEKHLPNAGHISGGGKKHQATPIKKHPSAVKMRAPKRTFSKSRRRSFSGKSLHKPKVRNMHRGGHNGGGGGRHKGGSNKDGGKKVKAKERY